MKIAFWKVWPSSQDFMTKIESRLIDSCSGWGGYWHTDLLFDDGTAFTSTLSTGTEILKRVYVPGEWTFIDVGLFPDEATLKAWALKHVGYPYDLFGLLGFITGDYDIERNKYFCSEIVVDTMQIAGIFKGLVGYKTSPNELYTACLKAGYKAAH